MNSFVVTLKYPMKSFVEFMPSAGVVKVGMIVGVRVYKSWAYAENKYTLTYIVDPEEFINVECDEEIDIPECHTSDFPRCYPLILGLKGEKKDEYIDSGWNLSNGLRVYHKKGDMPNL